MRQIATLFFKSINILITFCVATFLCTGATHGQEQVIIGASKDNTLYENATGSLSNGAGGSFFVGRVNITGQTLIRRGLLAFDIAGNVLPGATILSVTLTLNMSQTISGAQNTELRRALADWGEGISVGSGSGAPSTPGDATWIHTFYDTSFWSNAGGDFSPSPSASESVSGIGFYTWGSTPQIVSDVQAWLDTPSTNFGWLILGNESTFPTSKRFDTRENTNPAVRPMLTVTYNPIVGVHENTDLPTLFTLDQNYPNPFNPSTTIRYELPFRSNVMLKIYNSLGQEIRILANETQTAGRHTRIWDGTNNAGSTVPSGCYFYRMTAVLEEGTHQTFRIMKKMLLVR